MVNPTSVLVAAALLINPLAAASSGNYEYDAEYSPK